MTRIEAATFWDLIEARAAASPDAIMVMDSYDTTLSFDEYRLAVQRAAAGLAELGVGAGDTVAWQLPTWIESLVLMGAAARLGARQLPMLPMYRESELGSLLRRSEAKVWCHPSIWRGTDYPALASRVLPTVPGLVSLVCDPDLPVGDIAALPRPPAASTAATVRWIFPTSGTTSAPKGVLHSDRSIMAGGAAAVLAHETRPSDRYGCAAPITHIGGANQLAAALHNGHSVVLADRFDAPATAALFRRYGVTIAGGGPAFYSALLGAQRQQQDSRILPKLRFLTGGGAPMPPAMHDEVRDELGGRGCVHGYGMTEACIVAMNSPGDSDDRLRGTVGRPTPFVQVRVCGADGSEVPPGTEGEIRIHGEAVCQGYLVGSGSTPSWDGTGWFPTGDLGHFDDGGYLHITGRIKDIIIRKGENISATEIEDVLYTHPRIREVAVIGLPDPARGERVCAVVRVIDGAELSLADIASHCEAAGLMRQKTPEQLELVTKLPHNANGKVVKTELRARFSGASQPATVPPHPGDRR